jgi:alpha-mannosidase
MLSPDLAWTWLHNGYDFIPECGDDIVNWNYDHVDSAWHVAFTPGTRALRVTSSSGEVLLNDGLPLRVDVSETRAKAAEAAQRLFAKL